MEDTQGLHQDIKPTFCCSSKEITLSMVCDLLEVKLVYRDGHVPRLSGAGIHVP